MPSPPPPSPVSPPPPAPIFEACNLDDPCSFVDFCSDGHFNSHPTGHDPATGKAIYACPPGRQCTETLCQPGVVPAVGETSVILCTDSCLAGQLAGGINFTGSARNGICEDGREERFFVDGEGVAGTNVNRIGGCGLGTGTYLPLFRAGACNQHADAFGSIPTTNSQTVPTADPWIYCFF